jgi:hypothetical protein
MSSVNSVVEAARKLVEAAEWAARNPRYEAGAKDIDDAAQQLWRLAPRPQPKGCNGWTNYETWNLALWIGNERGSYEYWRERTAESYRNAVASKPFTKAERAKLDLADALKDETEENIPELQGFYADVLRAAVSEVNWYEIASNWVDEAVENMPTDDADDE